MGLASQQSNEVHAKFLGTEIDLKGKAAKNAPLMFSILALLGVAYVMWAMGNKVDKLDAKVDKVLFYLIEDK